MDENYIPRMRTMREVSKETGIPFYAIRKMCLQNEIAHIRCGRKILVNLDWLIRYLDTNSRIEKESDE